MMQKKKLSFNNFSVLPGLKTTEKIVQDMAFAGIKVNYVAHIQEYQSIKIVIDCNK